jgi:energy-coupling factor transport system permease protein
MATMFEYEPIETPIHRLNPITKIILFLSITFLSGFYLDPRLKIPLLILLVFICILARLPFKKYSGLLWVAVVAVLITSSFRAVFMIKPGYFRVFPAEFVMIELFQITPPDFPVFGRTAVTYGALLWLSAFPLTTATVVLAMAGLVHTTSQSEMVQVLYSAGLPSPAVFVIMVALRFIPEMIRQLESIQVAQRLRGWEIASRNPVKIARGYFPLLVPMLRYIIDSVDRMTISSKNRAFGRRRATGIRDLTFQGKDYLISGFTLTLFIAAIYFLFRYQVGNL